jgi:hypothetical protein
MMDLFFRHPFREADFVRRVFFDGIGVQLSDRLPTGTNSGLRISLFRLTSRYRSYGRRSAPDWRKAGSRGLASDPDPMKVPAPTSQKFGKRKFQSKAEMDL